MMLRSLRKYLHMHVLLARCVWYSSGLVTPKNIAALWVHTTMNHIEYALASAHYRNCFLLMIGSNYSTKNGRLMLEDGVAGAFHDQGVFP